MCGADYAKAEAIKSRGKAEAVPHSVPAANHVRKGLVVVDDEPDNEWLGIKDLAFERMENFGP